MTLDAGSRLGPYEVLAPLGAGGMGEVYRARDTRLGREVALKVLPAPLARDPEALARFEREARAVAALSHPNLLALHDVGSEDGRVYTVTELLEGGTLRERLQGGPLPPRKAAQLAAQIARGLAAAHERGIVHRDLKPENVFVTADGRIKILDFGLARFTPGAGVADADTQGLAHTAPGILMGTAAYMAPEQVRGKPADARSDVFALGAVLHEMLGGRRAFQRETSAETLTAILREDPPPLPGVPAGLARITARCLEKSPAERFQSARDLAFDLDSAADQASTTALPPSSASRLRLPARWGSAVAVAAAFALGLLARGPAVPRGAVPASFQRLTDFPGVESMPSLSPDGQSVVYAGGAGRATDVYLLRVGGHNPQALTADCPEDDTAPAFSPDGRRIAYRSECDGGGIFVMGATGETRRRVTDSGYDPAWSPDGRHLAVAAEATDDPLSRWALKPLISIVDVESGARRVVTDIDSMQPAWSPDGRRLAFWGVGEGGRRDLWTIPVEGGPAVRVTDDAGVDWCPRWSADGRHLYFSSGRDGVFGLWRVAVDPASGAAAGAPAPVMTPVPWAGWLSPSADGRRIAFASREEGSRLFRAGFDPGRERFTGPPQVVLSSPRVLDALTLSPDATQVAAVTAGFEEHIVIVQLDGTSYRQITDDGFRNRGPRWSADASRIAFYSNRGGRYEIWSMEPDGGGLTRVATGGADDLFYPVWAPGGSRLAAPTITSTAFFDLTRPLVDRRAGDVPKLAPGISFQATSWSADGRRLLGYASRDTDGASMGVHAFDIARSAFTKVTDDPAQTAVWLSDGERLIHDREGALVLRDIRTGASRVLLEPGLMRSRMDSTFSLSRDDRLVTFLSLDRAGDLWLASLGER